MRSLEYQRTIIAYHGCDESVVRHALLTGEPLADSENDYDWLGTGIYFWEFGPERALEWAAEVKKRNPRRIRRPAVLGAVINLGHCFDLLDTHCTSALSACWELYQRRAAVLPENSGPFHRLDCAVINFGLPILETESSSSYHTVRGVFQEGQPAFTGSDIRKKSHIQICVRDSAAILGYFKPLLISSHAKNHPPATHP